MGETTTMKMADLIAAPARLTRGYAELVAKDIPAEQFARIPQGVNTNHPAWIFGHLSLYPDKVLSLIERDDLASPRDDFESLFNAKSECRDDPDGSIYPPKDEITSHFFARTDAVCAALAEADDETLAKPNTVGPDPQTLNTVGAFANFLMTSHAMLHLGQVSAWRRMMGLGPCM